jgi:hypothetical protein
VADLLYGPTLQIGHAPSIALAFSGANDYDTAIEVDQGGQDSRCRREWVRSRRWWTWLCPSGYFGN